jgi:predicted acylesterase/phospholipase RssA
VTLCSALLCACATLPRKPAPPVLFANVAPPGFPETVRFLGLDRRFMLAHAGEKLSRLRAAAHGETLNILALSGGGAGGAFGTGALVGLTRRGDRPQFQIVTGVSVGALIAPFAFLGPEWDRAMVEALGPDRTARLLQSRGLALLFRPGFYRSKPLAELVDHLVTRRLIEAVATEAARGRVLFVATTDLDKQETVIWDMGEIAIQGGESARVLFRDVLVASASVPGLFPPALIRVAGPDGESFDEMHVDGGTATPFFVASEIAQILSVDFQALPGAEVLRGARVYVLVNGELGGRPQTTRERPVAVITRSFSTGLMHSSRRALELSAEFARQYQMDFHFSYIPLNYPFAGPFNFKAPVMQALFDYGLRCAEAGRLWMTFEQAVEHSDKAARSVLKLSDDCPLVQATP